MKEKVAMLLKTEVRRVNPDYSAGAERVFLDDAKTFIRHSMLTHAYIAGTLCRTSSMVKRRIKRIIYPHWIVDIVDECLRRTQKTYFADIFYTVKKVIYNFLELYYAIFFVLSERDADVYYVFDCPLVALLSPKKTLLNFHNFHGGLSYIFKFKKQMSKATIIFPSESLRDEYIQCYPDINTNACLVIYNAVDLSVFKIHKERLGKITFLFASAWVKEKGIQYIEYIVRELNNKYQDKINFIIGGSIDLWSLSQSRYKEMREIVLQMQQLKKTYSNVTMAGRVKRYKMPRLYHSATYLLFPSIWREPCALMVLESLASGIPVIAFARGGTREIITNNNNGYLIERVGKKYLLDKIRNVIDTFDRQKYLQMRTACQKTATFFSAQIRMKKIMHLIK